MIIILFNLLIAKMSTTYEKKEKASLEDWEYERAQIVSQFLLIGERSPLCMLPAPFNLITTILYPFHWAIINKKLFGSILGRGMVPTERRVRNNDKVRVISLAGTTADYFLGIIFSPIAAVYEIVSDILSVSFSFLDYYEDVKKEIRLREIRQFEKAKDKEEINIDGEDEEEIEGKGELDGDYTLNVSLVEFAKALVTMTLLFVVHLVMQVVSSPFLFIYYCFMHCKVVFSRTVQLEFANPQGDLLRIVYALDKVCSHTPKSNITKNVFRGKFIRGKVTRYGTSFDHRPTFIRVKAGPYSCETSPAVLDCPKKPAWKGLPFNSKIMVSFPENEVVIPAFPFGGDDLIRHLEVDVVEHHASGEKVVASCHIPGIQLHRWVYDGRFEGILNLVNHDDILRHHPLPLSGNAGREVVLVSEPKLSEDQSSLDLQDSNDSDLTRRTACRVSIERNTDGVVTNVAFIPGPVTQNMTVTSLRMAMESLVYAFFTSED